MGIIAKNHREKGLEKSKLLQLLQTFSQKELQEADDFLHSFFSTKKIELRVFTYLLPLVPHSGNEIEMLDLDVLFQQVHERLPVADSERLNLQNSCSDLYGYLLKFLAWKEMEEDGYEVELLKLRALKKRNLKNEYLSRIKRLSNKMEKNPKKDFWYAMQQTQLKDLHYYSTDIDKYDRKSNIVLETMNHLDDFYFTAKLKYGCELTMRNQMLQEENEIILLEEVMQRFRAKENDYSELTDLYADALKVVSGVEVEAFNRLRKKIEENLSINKDDRYVFVGYLLNYSAALYRTGDINGAKQCFELYKFGLKQELFTPHGYFPEMLFLTIVNIGCLLEALLEVRNFIEEWGPRLKPSLREQTIDFCMANWSVSKGDFETVIQICSRLTPKNPIHKIQSKLMEIKSYYELRSKYQKNIYRKCDQFEKYLKENKTLNTVYKDSGLNFLEIFKLLLRGKNKKEILKTINATQAIFAKEWLIEKTKEL